MCQNHSSINSTLFLITASYNKHLPLFSSHGLWLIDPHLVANTGATAGEELRKAMSIINNASEIYPRESSTQ